MRNEYDFSESIPNPYVDRLRKPVTLQLGVDVIDYFEQLSKETGIPCEALISLYLKDCVQTGRKPVIKWAA